MIEMIDTCEDCGDCDETECLIWQVRKLGDQLPKLKREVVCFSCGCRHEVRYGSRVENDKLVETKDLAYVECNGLTLLVGLFGKDIRLLAGGEDGAA